MSDLEKALDDHGDPSASQSGSNDNPDFVERGESALDTREDDLDLRTQLSSLGRRSVSRVLSTRDKPALPEGIELVEIEGTGDYLAVFAREGKLHPANPLSWSMKRRYMQMILVSVTQSSTMLASSMTSGFETEITNDLGGFAVLALSLYVFGYVAGPYLWAPMSEMYGRQIVFLASSILFVLFNGVTFRAQTFGALLGLRFAAGFAGAACNTNCGSSLGDIFNARDRGTPMAFYSLGTFAGPSLAPVIGSFVAKTIGWRWMFIIMAAYGALLQVLLLLLLPETYAPVIMDRKINSIRKACQMDNVFSHYELDKRFKADLPWYKGLNDTIDKYMYIPFRMLLTEPICLSCTIYIAFVYGIMYLLFPAYPIVYSEERHIEEGVSSLPFLAIMIGALMSVPLSLWYQHIYLKDIGRYGTSVPEMRLRMTKLGGPIMAISLLWLGWAGYKSSVNWAVPAVSGILFGVGAVLIFRSIQTYIIDTYEIYSASAQAANSAVRSAFGASFPLFATAMYHRLGVQWASTLLFFIMLLLCPLPFVFERYGEHLRKISPYASMSKL